MCLHLPTNSCRAQHEGDMLDFWWFEKPTVPFPWSSTAGSATMFLPLWSRMAWTDSCWRSKRALVLATFASNLSVRAKLRCRVVARIVSCVLWSLGHTQPPPHSSVDVHGDPPECSHDKGAMRTERYPCVIWTFWLVIFAQVVGVGGAPSFSSFRWCCSPPSLPLSRKQHHPNGGRGTSSTTR